MANEVRLRAVLNFVTLNSRRPGKTKTDPRTGLEIADVLRRAQVQGVVLNACSTASPVATTEEGHLAKSLLCAGVSFVLATAAVLMEAAAELLMGRFYKEILLNRRTVEDAVCIARNQLLRNRRRRAGFRQSLDLYDCAIPVLYFNQSARGWRFPERGMSDSRPDQTAVDELNIPAPILGRR